MFFICLRGVLLDSARYPLRLSCVISLPPLLVESSECALRTDIMHLEQDMEELWHFSWTRVEQSEVERERERERESYMGWVKLHINTLCRRCAGRT